MKPFSINPSAHTQTHAHAQIDETASRQALQSRVDRQLDEWKASIFDPSPSAAPSAAAAGAAAAGAAGGAPAGAGSK